MGVTRAGHLVLGLVVAVVVTVAVGCSGTGGPRVPGSQPALVAAVRARLAAESAGFASGNPALAASLASGDTATDDATAARAIDSQISHGDTTDYAFTVAGIDAYPLDGGATDFIAVETTRDDASGGVGRYLELFGRRGPADKWKAFATAGLNANIDPPSVRLTGGSAHLLTVAEVQAQGIQPTVVASRYASAMTTGADRGSLPPGTFKPSSSTTGEIDSETGFVEQFDTEGSASITWTARPGGEAVGLAGGALVFCSAEETLVIHRAVDGNARYFVTQDPEERAFGGLLAPGNYASVTRTVLVTLAVVVPTAGLPDVVGMNASTMSVTGTLVS